MKDFDDIYNLTHKFLDGISKNNYLLIKKILEDNEFEISNYDLILEYSKILLDKMLECYNSFSLDMVKLLNVQEVNQNIILQNLDDFPTCDQCDLLYEEIRKCTKEYIYELKKENIKIIIKIYSSDNKSIEKLARLIYTFIKCFANDLYSFDNFEINILLIDFPRLLVSDATFNELSSMVYFNNSSGYYSMTKKKIVVTRLSGVLGLLIHELIHSLKLDFELNLSNWEKEWIKFNNIKLTNNLGNFNEGICNTLASYFLALYSSVIIYSHNSKYSLTELFDFFFKMEYVYCFIQAAKVLLYFDFYSYSSFFNNTSRRMYYQNAQVFEYVILRIFMIYCIQ